MSSPQPQPQQPAAPAVDADHRCCRAAPATVGAAQQPDAVAPPCRAQSCACACQEPPPPPPPPDPVKADPHHHLYCHQKAGLHHVIGHVVSPPSPSPVKSSAACGCAEASARKLASAGGDGAQLQLESSPAPPALPPRPPPRPRCYDATPAGAGGYLLGGAGSLRRASVTANPNNGGIRKYVFWCCACGGLATILGALFLAVYFLLRSYTSTLGYFETIPTFVPATMLILTGLCVMSLARRKNRYSYLLKVCGLCCLVCALTCVLVTITTTVIHMNRLQTLRECVYTQKTRTCTCYSVLLEAHSSADDGMRYVFDSTPDCEVIHGALYSCLRAMFGLSVSGILVCIFSCMLVYQLLSHEKKKMYWEQLELRCRSFYQQHSGPASTHSSMRGPPVPSSTYCSCCEECRYPPVPLGPQVYPWDPHHNNERLGFWAPGRIGNFYSPNPEDNQTINPEANRRSAGMWSWRLPWGRGNVGQVDSQRDNSLTYQGGTSSSADSQYGFGGGRMATTADASRTTSDNAGASSSDPYSALDGGRPPPAGGVYVWGPPPPYSDPNSPARRPLHSPARYHHIHHHSHGHELHCQMNQAGQQFRGSRRTRPSPNNKDNYENTTETEVHQVNDNSESTDTSSCVDRVSHTLPARKVKKRTDVSSVKSTARAPSPRTNVQNIFHQNGPEESKESDHGYHEQSNSDNSKSNVDVQKCRFLPRLQGVENAAFQKQESSPQKAEATESEVYFADVSSCCNISVKNDGQDSSLYDEALDTQKPRLMSLQKPEVKDNTNQILQTFQENISSSTVTEDEDYLAHRMGNRQMSTRSRLPFPLPSSEELGEFSNDTCLHLLPKDISQSSLCSSVQTPLTETTDDAVSPDECCSNYFSDKVNQDDQTPKHRPYPSANQFLAPDAQYEVIAQQVDFRQNSNLASTIAGVNYDQSYFNQGKGGFGFSSSSPKNVPPKTLNLNQGGRRNLGSNISALIQNLGGNPTGLLLYGDANGEDEVQGQGCHSDGTMDSGWQSGSEKTDNRKMEGSADGGAHKRVNV